MRAYFPKQLVRLGLTCILVPFLFAAMASAQTHVAGMAAPVLPAGAVDGGSLPSGEPVSLTVYLQPSADRGAALDAFLTAVQTPGSAQYHQWKTPSDFGESFGATAGQVAGITAWAARQGLAVGTVSPAGTSLTLSGTAAQVDAALGSGLHAVAVAGQRYVANSAAPTLPASVAANVSVIDGLSTVPAAQASTLRSERGRFAVSDLLDAVRRVVEANSSRVLSIGSSACVEDVDAATMAAMDLLLKQAAAQGITTLASSGCSGRGSGSYPGSLLEALSVAGAPGITPAVSPASMEVRPEWQRATGLPEDDFRHEPDVTVSSLAALENTVLAILGKAAAGPGAEGSTARLGNLAGTLYGMAPEPGIFSQPDGAAAGTWEANTGLGLVDLDALAKHFPNGAAGTTVVIVPANGTYSITLGGSASYNITVYGSQAGVTPTGTVTVSFAPNGYTTSAPLPLTNGQASFSLSQLNGIPAANSSNYTVTATYNGDATYASNIGTTTLYVGQAAPTVGVSVAPNPVVSGQSTTLSATVTGVSGVSPTGQVVFTDTNGAALCTAGTTGSAITGTLTCTTTGLTSKSGTVTGTYQGDNNYRSGSTGTAQYSGPGITTPVTLSPITSPVVVNTQVTLTAGISPSSSVNNQPPTGTITFLDGTTPIGQKTISNYQYSATITATFGTVGTHSITAQYSGDPNYAFGTSAAQSLSVGPASSVQLTVAPMGNVVYGNAVTLTANITATPTSGSTLSGNIQFNIDGTDHVSKTVVLTNGTATTGTATLQISQALSAGTYVVNLYCPNANFDCSSFNAKPPTFTVVKADTTTTLVVYPSTFTAGQSIYASAFVAPAVTATGTGGVITGKVTFTNNGKPIGDFDVYLSNGMYLATTSPFTAGSASDNIVAVYNGDGNNSSSNSTGATGGGGGGGTTTPATTATTLSASPLAALYGSVVTLTANVIATPPSGSTSAGTPTGTVYFYDTNGTTFLLGSATLGANGASSAQAQLATTGLRAGTDVISATFAGSSGFNMSSTTVSVTVQVSDYTVSFTPTSVGPIAAGGSANVTVAVNAVNGFAGQVVLGCTAPDSSVTCVFSPTVINTSGLSTLTIKTTARSAAVTSRSTTVEAATGVAGAMLLCMLLPAVRRRRMQPLAVVVLLVLGTTLGCTNIVNGPTGSGLGSGTPAGTQVITITTSGTDGVSTTRHNYSITVNVQ